MAQKSRNKEMTQVFVTSNAEKVKPRVAVSWEGSAEGSRRMQDVLPSAARAKTCWYSRAQSGKDW